MKEKLAGRKFISIPENEVVFIHGKFRPAEIFSSDKISAVVTTRTNPPQTAELQVYRISPIGVELESLPELTLKPGLKVDLKIRYGSHTSSFSGLTIVTNHQEESKHLIGIKWVQEPITLNDIEVERRIKKRWICGEDFLPTGIAANPALFNDYIYFKIRDFSSDGLQLTTSLRNKFIIKGMILEATLTFPMVGQVQVPLQVENCRLQSIDGRDYLAIGVTLLSKRSYLSEILGQYALQFISSTNIQTLKSEGLIAKKASSAFDFSYVKTEKDYYEVLHLRLQAYGAVGKMNLQSPIESAGDIFDTRARILMVKHHGKLVGSVRTMFHGSDDQMEHEQFVKLPADFPKKHEIAEVTRVCTDPNYRGSDLVYSIMKYVFLIAAQANKRWILGCATDKLLPLYQKMGFQPVNIRFTHADLGKEEHTLLLGEVPKILCGSNVSPHLWKMLYSDLVFYLGENRGFQISPIENLRIAIYRALSPFTKTLSLKMNKK